MIPISIVIPTYRRESVLLDTLADLLSLEIGPEEILVVDQTENHEEETLRQLARLQDQGAIRWLKQKEPSIPQAMNRGLLESLQPIVLFLDDDIRTEPSLVIAHVRAHDLHANVLVAGRVIQPWEESDELPLDGPFRFAGLRPAWIDEFMGGNFSVSRELALDLGGFDENFVRVAYRFEAEFAYRFRQAKHRILFEPEACLHHLKAGGGTRTFGDYLKTAKPDHAVGAYYHALRTGHGFARWRVFASRPLRATATRHHLRRPWWIPATLIAEVWGMLWAIRLALSGPRYVHRETGA